MVIYALRAKSAGRFLNSEDISSCRRKLLHFFCFEAFSVRVSCYVFVLPSCLYAFVTFSCYVLATFSLLCAAMFSYTFVFDALVTFSLLSCRAPLRRRLRNYLLLPVPGFTIYYFATRFRNIFVPSLPQGQHLRGSRWIRRPGLVTFSCYICVMSSTRKVLPHER